ncbi:hypothetical protein [Halobacteriovorax sp. HLS]|uniref:hypothetical protein n=1 Tax=Halobacteriovorax sp. HLS TaxID=2234000 RepID=UPI000FD85D1B|nr:hypothetical protein [Halobacteriovorax sp. HLS]
MEQNQFTQLIGDPLESFYQLGLKDQKGHSLLLDHMKVVLTLGIPKVDKIIQDLAAVFFDSQMEHNRVFKQWSKQYAQGLGISDKELIFALLLPELSSCLSKWLPSLGSSLLGCSTMFFWDENEDCPAHGRILDFPLIGSFDKAERTILYDFPNLPKVYSFGSVGFPFPSITSMNEYGVTLALHQKFTDILDINGRSVFDIGNELIFHAKDLSSALEILKKANSFTAWCFNMTFADGTWLSADLMGDKLVYETGKITKGEIKYFNNELIDEELHKRSFFPIGMKNHNSMRSDCGNKKVSDLSKKKKISDLDILKSLGTPQKISYEDTLDWKLGTLTPTSVHIVTMSPMKARALSINGIAPKLYSGQYLEHTELWDKPNFKLKQSRAQKYPPQLKSGLRHYALAQVSFDHKDLIHAYHHIQMAHDELKGTKWEHISFFYFLVFQFMKEKHKKVRSSILEDFKDIHDKLPELLQDHCVLFIWRLERILYKSSKITENDIKNTTLKNVFRVEQKIPGLILHRTTTLLMSPRLDLLDVIYPLV